MSLQGKRKRPAAPSLFGSPAQSLDGSSMSWLKGKRRRRPSKGMVRGGGPARSAQQTLLDFGQRSLGRRRECELCGMVFVIGDRDDEAAHGKLCEGNRKGPRFPGWKRQRTVPLPAGDAAADNLSVVEVRPRDPSSHLDKVREALEPLIRDVELRIAGLTDGESAADAASGKAPPRRGGAWVAFLAVSRQRVVGVCVARPLPRTEAVFLCTDAEGAEGSEGSEGSEGAEGAEGAFVGIDGIWVLRSERRKGVATAMLEAARRRAVFGGPVHRSQVAFSQPTAMGRRLASAFQGRGGGAAGTAAYAVYGGARGVDAPAG